MNWKKLSAFAPMLAVIVLAGCMGKTLAGYTPATYEAKAEEITLQEETTQSTEEKGQQTSRPQTLKETVIHERSASCGRRI